ncbi:DUF4386 domain-containing protein [Parasphingorhabdus halotolerans]|uniref:DUF4386 domain-containing protein n=1 Tax=Parasphingorhabdus halotolerans TaxID=2725558 RepID=A0A6H2DN47_9SPHN|nr:DUF4386 domain-containing protein [Parasphingorhabdus halotolerans]QJB70092.1 DUF4386 domain-containing protein [Parasphingorhabdus halotolerans]
MKDVSTAVPLKLETIAHIVGWSLLGTILVGVLGALTVGQGIDINLSADVIVTAQNMLEAETQLRAKAYIALLVFALQVVISAGLFMLLRSIGQLLAAWSLIVSLGAALLVLMSAVFNLNAAELAGDIAYAELADEELRLLLTGLQATSDYTSFHLGLILSSISMVGFAYLFLRSGMIPKLIAGWGIFAFSFMAAAVVARDFIPIIGHSTVTASFMISNLIALVAMGSYLAIKGVRSV